MRGQQHSFFDTWTGVLGKVSKLLRQKMSRPVAGSNPPTFVFMPNALTYWAIRARHLLSHIVEYWLWRYRYFWSKVNFWNVNCARATAFIFDTRTSVLGKVSKSWDRKCIDLSGTQTPNLRINAECSDLLSYQGHMLLNTGSGGTGIFEVKLTFEILTVRWQQHSFSTHKLWFET